MRCGWCHLDDISFEHVVQCRTRKPTGYIDDQDEFATPREGALAARVRLSQDRLARFREMRGEVEQHSQERLLGSLLGLREKLRDDSESVTYTITLEWETTTRQDVIGMLEALAASLDPNLRVLAVE